MRQELVLLADDVFVRPFEHGHVRQLVSRHVARRAAPPFRACVERLAGARQVARVLAAFRHAAVSDAARQNSEVGVGALEHRAAMLVAPVPGEDALAAQDLSEIRMIPELRALRFPMRVELVMREQDDFPVAGLAENLLEPGHLLVVDVVILVRDVQSDQRPVLVLEGEVAGLLAEFRKDFLKVRKSARIHLVVRVDARGVRRRIAAARCRESAAALRARCRSSRRLRGAGPSPTDRRPCGSISRFPERHRGRSPNRR